MSAKRCNRCIRCTALRKSGSTLGQITCQCPSNAPIATHSAHRNRVCVVAVNVKVVCYLFVGLAIGPVMCLGQVNVDLVLLNSTSRRDVDIRHFSRKQGQKLGNGRKTSEKPECEPKASKKPVFGSLTSQLFGKKSHSMWNFPQNKVHIHLTPVEHLWNRCEICKILWCIFDIIISQ